MEVSENSGTQLYFTTGKKKTGKKWLWLWLIYAYSKQTGGEKLSCLHFSVLKHLTPFQNRS